MRVIDLMVKDLIQLVRDWKAATFLVAMPILFTIFFGFLFAGTGGEEDPRLPVCVLNQDQDGVLSGYLVDMVEASDSIRPVLPEEGESWSVADLEAQVQDQEVAGAIIVPSGYSDDMLAGEQVAVTVIADTGTTAGATAQTASQTAVVRLNGAVQAARLSGDTLVAQGGTLDQAYLLEGINLAIDAWQDAPLTVESTQTSAVADDETESNEDVVFTDNPYTHSSPSMMIQFSIAGLIGAANVLVLERKSRSLQRLLTSAISRAEIIVGHFLAMFVMILAQLVLLVGFGQLLLGVDYLREPLALVLLVLTMALWTAALGLLIGVLAKSEEQAIIFSMIPMFVFSGLGGAWMPLEYTGETFQTIGHLLPTAWAIDGFKDIIIRGLGLSAILPAAGVMLAYAIVLFALAVWFFKFE